MNEEIYQWPQISGPVIVTSDIGWRAPTFSVLATNIIAEKHLCATIYAHQCFPLSHLKDAAVAQFRQHYANPDISNEDVFHYIYALLHHPDYRTRYAANLKRELPRIPFAPDFAAFASAGRDQGFQESRMREICTSGSTRGRWVADQSVAPPSYSTGQLGL